MPNDPQRQQRRPQQRDSVPPRPRAHATRGHRSGGGYGPGERGDGFLSGLIADPDVRRWAPIGASALVVVGVLGFAMSTSADERSSDIETTVVESGPVATSVAPQPISTVATTAPLTKTVLDRTIQKGMAGNDVKAIQERLVELGFDPGPADGSYGHLTISAMWAYKKLVMGVPRAEVTDEVTPEIWDEMQDPIIVEPRRPNATTNHVEIYLPEQVMVVFHDKKPRLITHIASGELDEDGNPAEYCEKINKTVDDYGVPLEEPIPGTSCGVAKTPGGVFEVQRMRDGYWEGSLGGMWDPVYFNIMIAIHGAREIPLEPASHGCVRIERHISAYFQDLVEQGDQVYVWNGIKEPEEITHEDSLPRFDYFTPDTTVPATTVPAATTTTTQPKATTTTAAPKTTTTTSPVTTTTVATNSTVAGN